MTLLSNHSDWSVLRVGPENRVILSRLDAPGADWFAHVEHPTPHPLPEQGNPPRRLRQIPDDPPVGAS